MGFSVYEKVDECSYCGNRAEILFIRKGWFTINWRFFCKDCAKKHSRTRDDINANYKE